ncbi:MAG: hypothetical protein M1837_002408 [Sclerophora amabilis]|nr:MAG: hypothetical protein M1837_002408 [Sclerophora amabilis]
MYATKRKFHTLLNSLTNNASSTSLSSNRHPKTASSTTLSANVESASKKRRIDRPRSTILEPSSRRKPGHTIENSPREGGAGSNTTGESSTKLPNYAPWDRGQFLDRLKTFRHVEKWDTKPLKVNEVQWAKRGWRCVGRERVGCVGGCGKEVYIKLSRASDEGTDPEDVEENDWAVGADETLINRYAEMIVTEHDGNCLWRRRGCDDSIYRLPLAHPPTSISGLQSRYESLAAISSELPSNISLPPEIDSQIQNLVRHLSADFLQPAAPSSNLPETIDVPPNPSLNTRALILSLFGWRADTSDHPLTGLATCDACFRRLGLWLFSPRPTSSASTTTSHAGRDPTTPKESPSEEAAAEAEEDQGPCISRLNPLAEHRSYCPWVNALSQNGISTTTEPPAASLSSSSAPTASKNLSGWQTLLRVLKSSPHFRSGQEEDEDRRPTTNGTSVSTTATTTNETASILSGGFTASGGTSSHVGGGEDEISLRDEKDKERWARLKRLKKVFDVKRSMASRKRRRVAAGAAAAAAAAEGKDVVGGQQKV